MIESIVLDYLIGEGKRAYMEDPPGTPELPYYVIQKTSGGEENRIRRAMLAIQSFGGSLYQAAQANEELIALMRALPTNDQVSSVELNSDYNFTDAERKRYRYQAVFDIVHY